MGGAGGTNGGGISADGGGSGGWDRAEADDVANEEEEDFEIGMRRRAIDYTTHDINQDNKLDFDEFYMFVKKMEKYVAAEETPEKIVSEMFDLIDTDASGEITVAELASTMERLKQELAVDDIYEMMKDFDEDGGGALDKEEFGELVKRVGIFGEEEE